LNDHEIPFWITTKLCNIVAKPFNAQALVQKSEVLITAWKGRKAEDVETIAVAVNSMFGERDRV
jgi:hypothetical protein